MMIEEYLEQQQQQQHDLGQQTYQEDMSMFPAVIESPPPFSLEPAPPAPPRGHQRRHRRAVTEPNFDFLYKQQQREQEHKREQNLLGLGPSSSPKPDLLNTMAHSFVKQEQMRVLSSGNLAAQANSTDAHLRSASVVSLEESTGPAPAPAPEVFPNPPQMPQINAFPPQDPQPAFGMVSPQTAPEIQQMPAQVTPFSLEPQPSVGMTAAAADPAMPQVSPFPLEPQPSIGVPAVPTVPADPEILPAPTPVEPVIQEDVAMTFLDPLNTASGDDTDPLMEIDIEPVVMSTSSGHSNDQPPAAEEPSRLSRFLDQLQSVADQQTMMLQQQQQQQQQQRKRHRRAVSEGPTRFDLSHWEQPGLDNNHNDIANTMMMTRDRTEDAALFEAIQQW